MQEISIYKKFILQPLDDGREDIKSKKCHCTCMTGMRETCNHVVTVIYWIEATVRVI